MIVNVFHMYANALQTVTSLEFVQAQVCERVQSLDSRPRGDFGQLHCQMDCTVHRCKLHHVINVLFHCSCGWCLVLPLTASLRFHFAASFPPSLRGTTKRRNIAIRSDSLTRHKISLSCHQISSLEHT